MAKKKKTSNKNQALKVPEELQRIADLRERLVGTDRPDHLEIIDGWENKVKKAAILLSLQRHEGIQILIEKAEEELVGIDEILRSNLSKPKELSPEGAMQFAMEQYALHTRKEFWEWFRSLFTDAVRDIKDVRADLDAEDALADEAPGY